MLQDYNTSMEINTQFQAQAKNFLTGIEFSIKIFCKANWPIEKNYSLFLPKGLQFLRNQFDEFYKKTSSNNKVFNKFQTEKFLILRKIKVLEWVYSLSSLTLRMTLESKVYEISLSIYQATVLFQFESERDSLSLKEIADKLEFPEKFCQKLIKSMVCLLFIIYALCFNLVAES